MNKLPVIAYRAEASTELGLGHFIHAMRFARLLKDKEIARVHVISGKSDIAKTIATKHHVPLKICPWSCGVGDFKTVYKICRQIEACAVAVNFSKTQLDSALPLFQALKDAKLPQIHFDNPCEHFSFADILINALPFPNYGLDYSSHPALYQSLDYLLLSAEFVRASKNSNIRAGRADRILVFMGGGDKDNISIKILRALKNCNFSGVVELVIGLANPHYDSLKGVCGQLPFEVVLHQNPSNLADIASRCDIGFSALGVATYEFASTGLPVVILANSIVNGQVAQSYSKAGAAVSLGYHEDCGIESLSERIHLILGDEERLTRMSQRAKVLIDGKGPERIVEILSNFIDEIQKHGR